MMKPAPKQMMYRSDLMDWLAAEGYTETQVRRLISQGVIKSYRWSELVKSNAATLPKWSVFLEAQVREALEALLTT